MKLGQKVIVTQIRSAACRPKKVDRMLEAIGLGRVGKSKTFTLNESVAGTINRLGHLVKVSECK